MEQKENDKYTYVHTHIHTHTHTRVYDDIAELAHTVCYFADKDITEKNTLRTKMNTLRTKMIL